MMMTSVDEHSEHNANDDMNQFPVFANVQIMTSDLMPASIRVVVVKSWHCD